MSVKEKLKVEGESSMDTVLEEGSTEKGKSPVPKKKFTFFKLTRDKPLKLLTAKSPVEDDGIQASSSDPIKPAEKVKQEPEEAEVKTRRVNEVPKDAEKYQAKGTRRICEFFTGGRSNKPSQPSETDEAIKIDGSYSAKEESNQAAEPFPKVIRTKTMSLSSSKLGTTFTSEDSGDEFKNMLDTLDQPIVRVIPPPPLR